MAMVLLLWCRNSRAHFVMCVAVTPFGGELNGKKWYSYLQICNLIPRHLALQKERKERDGDSFTRSQLCIGIYAKPWCTRHVTKAAFNDIPYG